MPPKVIKEVKDLEPPEKTHLDISWEGVKALAEVLPAGSLLTYGLQQFIQQPLEKRMNQFYKEVADAINNHTLQISELSSNERFVSILLQAGNIYMRNHQVEKLKALRNAVINSIETPTYDESMQTVFLALIDRFTHWHLHVLDIFADPRIFHGENKSFGRLSTISRFENINPFFATHREFLELIFSDLKSARLIDYLWDSVEADAMNRGLSSVELTKIGRDFLEFIKPV